MTLIKTEPVGTIEIENGEMRFLFPDLTEPKPCWNCQKPTIKTRMGFIECEDCSSFNFPCHRCCHGLDRASYICNGNDLEDHVKHWWACGIRGWDEKFKCIRVPFNPQSSFNAWGLSINDYKSCFKSKEDSP